MKTRNIQTIYRKEMKDTLRDRRTLIFMLIVPIVAIPLLMMFTSSLMIGAVTKAQEEEAAVVFEGFEQLPADLQESFREAPSLDIKMADEYADTVDLIEDIHYYIDGFVLSRYFLNVQHNVLDPFDVCQSLNVFWQISLKTRCCRQVLDEFA